MSARQLAGATDARREVLVGGVWRVGELRMWSQRDDGSWDRNVQWRPAGEPTRRFGTFWADLSEESLQTSRRLNVLATGARDFSRPYAAV
jgi:hypothetical protein